MKKLNNKSNLSLFLGKFVLGFGLILAFLFTAFNSTAQCNIKADFKYSTDGLTVKLQDNSSGAHKVLGWTLGDGNGVRNDATTKHTYAKGGTYKVCLIIYGRFNQTSNKRCLDTICKRVTVKDPCANFKPDFRFKVSKNQALFVAQKISGARYTWVFGDAFNRGNGRFAVHNYKKPGTYEVCLQVKTKTCVKKICKKVTIKDPCDRIKEDFDVKVIGNIAYFKAQKLRGAKYTWGFGDGSKRGVGSSLRHKYSKPGTYKVCLQIKTRKCKKLICKKIVIKDPCDRIKEDFVVRIDGNVAYFKAQSIVGARYTWSFGDGTMRGYGKNVRHKFKPGTYRVCLQIKTKSCKKLICKKIIIKDPCDAIKADFNTRFDGNVAYFKAPEYKGAKYTWIFGEGGKRGYGNPVKYQYAKPGTYTVCLQIKTRTCKKLICKKITIKDPCDRLQADFRSVTSGNYAKFESKNSEAAYFLWNFGDGTTSRDEHVKHEYKKPGTYKVCLTVWTKDKKCKFTVCHKVTIKDPCDRIVANFDYKESHGKVLFEAKSYNGASYTWIFGDGSGRDTGRVVKHQYTKPGTYTVCMQVKVGNCTKKICKKITIKSCSGTITISPNPAHCLTQIKHNLGTTNRMVISDVYGKTVYSDTNVANNSILDVTNFRVGTYVVRITDSNGNVALQRLIKK